MTTIRDYTVKPLGPDTWDAFAGLAERHNGVWNGCWCTWFHPACAERGKSPEGNRAIKQRLVNEGRPRPWSLTATGRWPGASTEPRRNCPASTTARSTRPSSTSCRTTG